MPISEPLVFVTCMLNNEQPRLKKLFESLSSCPKAVGKIFFDDNSTDNTLQELVTNNKVVFPILATDDFANKRNQQLELLRKMVARQYYGLSNNNTWALFVDADERFDPTLLQNLPTIIKDLAKEDTVAFAFPRVNLPNPGKSYPDYQVRLIKISDDDLHFNGALHEVISSEKHNQNVLAVAQSKPEYTNYCIVLNQYPILHQARRKDLTRPWW